MNQLEQIEQLVEALPRQDLAKFRDWFLKFDWKVWDKELEEDFNAGRLDNLITEAMADLKAGKAREI